MFTVVTVNLPSFWGYAGQDECEAAVRLLEEEAARGRRERASGLRLMPAALYAGLPAAAQLAALEPPPRGYRKVRVLGI